MSLEQLNEQYGCKFHKGFFTAVRVRPFFSKNSDKSAGDSEEFVNEQNSSDGKRKIGDILRNLYVYSISG